MIAKPSNRVLLPLIGMQRSGADLMNRTARKSTAPYSGRSFPESSQRTPCPFPTLLPKPLRSNWALKPRGAIDRIPAPALSAHASKFGFGQGKAPDALACQRGDSIYHGWRHARDARLPNAAHRRATLDDADMHTRHPARLGHLPVCLCLA